MVRVIATGLLAAGIAAAYVALILAGTARFNSVACLLCGTAAGIAAGALAYKKGSPETRAEKAGWLAALTLAAGSFFLTVPPSEMLLGGWDPGVYVHTAAAIAREGSLQIPADDFQAFPQDVRRDLVRQGTGWTQLFPGMFLLPNGQLSPQFMHLYPSLLAIGYAQAGVWGALLINPVLHGLAILLLYGFASKLLGGRWGLLAALLLAVNPAQIWQAKFSTAELLTQVLLLAGLIAFLDFTRRRRVLPAAVSGLMFGLSFLCRYDAVLLIVPLVLLLVVLANGPAYRRSVFAFLVALGVMGAHAWLHMTWVAPFYRPLSGLVFPLLGAALFLTAVLIAAVQIPAIRRGIAVLLRRPMAWRGAGLSMVLAFSVLAGYVRPRLTVDGRVARTVDRALASIGQGDWMEMLAGVNAFNVAYLESIFSFWGLVLALAGLGVLIWRVSDRGAAIWLVAALATTAIYMVDVFHDHFMMWVSRRFIPVVIPLLTVGIAAALQETYRQTKRKCRLLAAPLATLLILMVVAGTTPKTVAMGTARDWPGLASWFQDLTRRMPEDTVVFSDQPGFAAPLRFMYGIRAFEVGGGKSCAQFLSRHAQVLRPLRGPIGILTMREQSLHREGVILREMFHTKLESSILEQPRQDVPSRARPRGGSFVFYTVEFTEERKGDSADGPASGQREDL
jgi:hypothetical protein